MKVNEIYRSIIGESTYIGYPCIFIRLTGCNLRCRQCDKPHVYEKGKDMTIESIINRVRKLYADGDIIEITGGEPLLQKDEVEILIKALRNLASSEFGNRIRILIETNGSIRLPTNWNCEFVMNWKCPSSGMNCKMEYENLRRLKSNDELKFVLETDEDYECMKKILGHYNELNPPIIISTTWECSKTKRKGFVERILKDKINCRFQVQINKIIWGT